MNGTMKLEKSVEKEEKVTIILTTTREKINPYKFDRFTSLSNTIYITFPRDFLRSW